MHSRRKIQKERWRIQMKGTYKAVEVSAPGTLRVVERQVSEPGAGQVRIRVEACGICYSDAATVTGIYPGLNLPRVPGHEVVGRRNHGAVHKEEGEEYVIETKEKWKY